MQIIKDGKITPDDVQHLSDDEAPSANRFTVSCTRWKAEKDALLKSGHLVGIRLKGDNSVADIAEDLNHFEVIVVEFPALADGRSFSLARLLRERFGFKGEIRALGDFIRDQVYFLARVGVNAFEPVAGTDLEKLLPAFADFTLNYQTAADGVKPIFRQRI